MLRICKCPPGRGFLVNFKRFPHDSRIGRGLYLKAAGIIDEKNLH